jgi:hypothetical protein
MGVAMTSGDRAILRALEQTEPSATPTELLARILERLERLDDRLEDFARVHLNARFPYGRPTDRWARR